MYNDVINKAFLYLCDTPKLFKHPVSENFTSHRGKIFWFMWVASTEISIFCSIKEPTLTCKHSEMSI